ncbi:hypothetical protein ADH76_08655 [Enterocloster clostridioformis]|uniref:flagellar FlbD family protein n=1 Tax=Enterocloster clostridioformis TaxID=1531 RepID=UPI00080C840F|nr:flagellar FlbD family protein [Enterocloster clostridioformis]ANU49617.1 hypothetical protein A4V08_31115 [Lachnoclostridium sp. YL32]NDO28942.1 hypothetical protein [Enterocloster clostridioformis]OXE71332.1 hypothetical protein ADH76_08655 [Enterocloster clostridioformis]QQR01479.1 flagellar FlbD family protein [Enterocloster clostridioformis]
MIKVIRLNGEALLLNFFQIESVEMIPETKIKMMNGTFYLVKDSAESITQQVKEAMRDCCLHLLQ